MINSWCAELCKTITALQTCWVQEISEITVSPTNHQSTVNGESALLHAETQGKNTLDHHHNADTSYLPPSRNIASKICLGNILTSHLSSFGSSIVVGNDCLAVNQVKFPNSIFYYQEFSLT